MPPRRWSGARSAPATGRGFAAAVRASFVNAALLAVLMTWPSFCSAGRPDPPADRPRRGAGRRPCSSCPTPSLLPLVSVWAFLFDGMFFGATRTAELRNGMVAGAGLVRAAAWLLVPPFGNHGLWLAFLVFLGARAVILALIYRRAEARVAFVPA